MAEGDAVSALIVLATIAAAVALAKAIYWIEDRSIRRESATGQARLERYLAEQHAGRRR